MTTVGYVRPVISWFACGLAIAASALIVAPVAGVQQPGFRASVDLVHLDVSVLDRDRRPVRGLTAANFTILEDGVPRPISAFASLEVQERRAIAAAEPGAWMAAVEPDVQANDAALAPEGRLFVLILDDGMTPADPQAATTAKKIAHAAIDRLGTGDQMAVVFTVNGTNAQNFTGDRARLKAAVERFKPGYATHLMGWDTAIEDNTELEPTPPPKWVRTMDQDAGFRMGSILTLESVANSLMAAPQRRKAILYVTPGVLIDQELASGPRLAGSDGSRASMAIYQSNSSLAARMPELYRRMRQANINIYTLDPMGLGGLEAYVNRAAAGVMALRTATQSMSNVDDWYDTKIPPMPMDLARKVATVNLDFLKTAAGNTGGLAITDTNDLERGIGRIFDENATYYLLGFTVPPEHRPGSLHRLEVKVNRANVTVRTRSGYQVPEPARAPATSSATAAGAGAGSGAAGAGETAATASLVTPLISGPVPSGTLPMRVSVAPFAGADGGSTARVAVVLGISPPAAAASGRGAPAAPAGMAGLSGEQTFDIEVRAFTPEGDTRLAERRTGKAVLRPSTGGDAAFDLLANLPLAPGRYELRVGAMLAPSNLAGSVFATVEVPDFAKGPLAASGVVLDARPAGQAGPLDAFKGLLPVVPTSRREFRPRDAVRAFLRVYQSGADPLETAGVLVTIHDRNGQTVYSYPYRLPVNRFDAATRAADFTFDLPLTALESGPHLITFKITRGEAAVTRQVRIQVR
jgi:VWFA-related protein